ncbi:glycosyltransferase [Ferrimonas lipolytica]|uniref:Glycosyltransferase family 4 protein n=1 Tax=Ferrimonas lipolytica TaxID=2724191 RepID=A0A6H1UH59_9GAMM|nr:glycosyltransferase [Ferrimonas lipolytica]QIZ78445.1 glycosyltransferase family 4 protein [Ferrimonas lipolytica]
MSKVTPARRCVLHLAVEYPSLNRSTNTPAVRNFIRANPEVDYRVFALRRTANPSACNALVGDDQGDNKVTSMKYWGLPYGILLFLSMTIVAWRIYRTVQSERLSIASIHAHKFSFEGIAGWWLSRWLNVPLALSVRGEAEQKILRYKPHYKPFYRRQLNDATKIYYVSAWFKAQMVRHFNIDPHKESLLPNFVAERDWSPVVTFQHNHLVSIMDLNVQEKKGFVPLLQAVAQLTTSYPDLRLDIIGGGFPKSMKKAQQHIDQLGLAANVTLLGQTDNQQLLQTLPNYAGMVLPSRNETFGMAYVESLLSGVPIMYSNATGIDGFLDGIEAGIGADPNSVDSIAVAIQQLLLHQQPWRQWLKLNHKIVVERFSRAEYIKQYNLTFGLS